MKFLTTFIVVLFSFHFNGQKCESGVPELPSIVEHVPASTTTEVPSTPLAKVKTEIYSIQHTASTSSITTSTPLPTTEQNPLENISIQDLLLSGIDSNEKIRKNIIHEIQNFPTKFRRYRKPIGLKTENYVFPKKLIKYDLDKGYLTFYNISVSHWYDIIGEMYSEFSYSLKCDSSKPAKMSVGLPTNIQISANFSLTSPLAESVNEGGIAIVIRNGTILRHDVTSENFSDQFPKISYSKSKIDIQFDAGPQSIIYSKLAEFFDEVEFTLREFFAQQFIEQITRRGLSLSSDCSSLRYTNLFAHRTHLPQFNNLLYNLYFIPDTKIETWNGITLSTGPIVMEGFSFNSAELHVSKERDPDNVYNWYVEKLTARVRTGLLKGKFEWNYNLDDNIKNNSPLVFSFSIDSILFENSYMNYNRGGSQQNMNVYLGKIKIKPSSPNYENNEIKFARIFLIEYLKSTISKSLEKSLSDKSGIQMHSVRTFFDDINYSDEVMTWPFGHGT